jgi:hypothetical protein
MHMRSEKRACGRVEEHPNVRWKKPEKKLRGGLEAGGNP